MAHRLQFRLATLMIAMLVVCVLTAILFAFPPMLRVIVLLGVELGLCSVLITGVLFGIGVMRVFCLGALLPSVLLLFGGSRGLNLGFISEPGIMWLVLWTYSAICGGLSVLMYEFIQRQDSGAP